MIKPLSGLVVSVSTFSLDADRAESFAELVGAVRGGSHQFVGEGLRGRLDGAGLQRAAEELLGDGFL